MGETKSYPIKIAIIKKFPTLLQVSSFVSKIIIKSAITIEIGKPNSLHLFLHIFEIDS